MKCFQTNPLTIIFTTPSDVIVVNSTPNGSDSKAVFKKDAFKNKEDLLRSVFIFTEAINTFNLANYLKSDKYTKEDLRNYLREF